MNNETFTVDLHCHPNLKSFNSGYPKPKRNMWENIEHKAEGRFAKTVNDISQHVLKESQTNLYKLAQGNVRVFQISLYPTERGFMHMRNIPKILLGKRGVNTLQSVITGYEMESVVEMKKHYRYFEDLQKEYEYVYEQQGKSPDKKQEFKLVNNYTELEQALKKKNTLIGIITIEGAHVFGTGAPKTDELSLEELQEQLSANIFAVKQWEFPPFMVNLGHHFWNHLTGHATSFKRPINGLINQNKGKDKGITKAGWHVIRELLSRQNGKRIIIDTKHMSLAARKEYYAFVTNYNVVNPEDMIPIVTSHAGMNGYSTMDSSIKEPDIVSKIRHHRFYRWSINVSNEEARIIHASGGLIGLMMDRGMLGGLNTIKTVADMKDAEKQRKEYARLFWDNAFQIIKAVANKKGWETVAMGSDFDGTITHMDTYESAAKMPLLENDLIEYLKTYRYQEELWYGYTPQELVRKIMQTNAMAFYKRFFV